MNKFYCLLVGLLLSSMPTLCLAQTIDNTGCVAGNFMIDAGLYSGERSGGDGDPIIGTRDWFQGSSGEGLINEAAADTMETFLKSIFNPLYERRMSEPLSSIRDNQILIDGLYARDYFGGTGGRDLSTYETASKNGEDPAIWDAGEANVLGKNDLVNVAGHMFRDGTTPTDNLWFVGIINRAEPGGSAYMDFEFFVEDVQFNSAPVPGDDGEGNFDSGGPDLGHTAFTFHPNGDVASVGDFLFNAALVNGGIDPNIDLRIWVSRDDYDNSTPNTFNWGTEFDGAFNGSPFGYALISPTPFADEDACGKVNILYTTEAPPWGTRNSKTNTWSTTYQKESVAEFAANMTAFGIDHSSLAGTDPCEFPINTFMVKTRASASFTAQLKDFAGPYKWGFPSVTAGYDGDPLLACDNLTVTLEVQTDRDDFKYQWTTVDGNIVGPDTLRQVVVDKPGLYTVLVDLPFDCPLTEISLPVSVDPLRPLFNDLVYEASVSCDNTMGSIDVTVSGATPPYLFEWKNSSGDVISMEEDPQNLPPGNYTLQVTDAIACTQDSDTITVLPEVPPSFSEITANVDCFGNNSGSIDLVLSGGHPDFSYNWSNGGITEDITLLYAGTYMVTTTDADGCEEIHTITIDEPPLLTLSVTAENDTNPDPGIATGTIDLTVNGGTPGFTYDWDEDGVGDNDDLEDLENLNAGVYTVTVTDVNGCTAVISATIFEPEICFDGIDNDGDGQSDCNDEDCVPPIPDTITTSNDSVCVGEIGVLYSTIDIGADSYTWTVPAGASITAGQNTSEITVDWIGSTGGDICVVIVIEGCSGQATCISVIPNDRPLQPGGITND